MGELIAVLSGKGGTGKTSVCAGIATALAAMGESVLCIDCDVGLRNLDISLGLANEGALSFVDISERGYALEQATVHPLYPQLRFLTAPMSCPGETIDQAAFGAMLKKAREQFSYIFLDAPAGVDTLFRLTARFADRVLLVTNSDPASIRDAARAGDLLELMGKKHIRLIVNRVSKKMAAAMALTVDDIMDQAGLPLIGIVPEDANVPLAATFCVPLREQTKKGAAAACQRIAKRIKGLSVPITI